MALIEGDDKRETLLIPREDASDLVLHVHAWNPNTVEKVLQLDRHKESLPHRNKKGEVPMHIASASASRSCDSQPSPEEEDPVAANLPVCPTPKALRGATGQEWHSS